RNRPCDGEGGIVPEQAPLMGRAVIGGDLVGDEGVRRQRAIAVGEALRHPERPARRGRQFYRDMLAERVRFRADVDGDVEDRALVAAHELALGKGLYLEMQTTHRSGQG